MSPNQRLVFAVVLSIVFFVAYTAIFPPVVQDDALNKNPKSVSLKADEKQEVSTKNVEEEAGHAIATSEVSTSSTEIVTIKSDDYIMKIDTLGRISSKELLQDKFNNKDGEHAQIISRTGTKPLFIRFADENLNKEAMSIPYTASVSEVELKSSAKK